MALAWAWRLGAAGNGVVVLGEGEHSEISASPCDGPPTLPQAVARVRCVVRGRAHHRVAGPRFVSTWPRAAPDLVPVTGAPRARQRKRARTTPI